MAGMRTSDDPPGAAVSPAAAGGPRADQPAPAGVHLAGPEASALVAGGLAALCRPWEAGWQKVKGNASRTVYRGALGGRVLYVKHYHPRSALRRLARRLGLSAAKREMRFMQYLASRGVATAPVLAAMWEPRLEWLATAAVEPSQPADAWHAQRLREGAAGAAAVRRATVALARLVGRMHAAGVIHRDLHCGNVLIRQGAEGPEAVLMDLHRAARRGRLSRRARAANLAQLFHDRRDFTTRTDRLRFLKSYLSAAGTGGSLRGWQFLIEDFARRHTRRQHADRDRRAAGENRYFCRLRLGGAWRGQAVLASKRRMAGSRAAEMEFTPAGWLKALERPEALLDGADGAEVVKDSASCRIVRRRLRVGDRDVDVYVKRFRRKKPWKFAVDCFRPSRAVRAFRYGHALLARHVATALPLAALERRRGPFLRDSILVTEACEGTLLGQFLGTLLAKQPRAGAVPWAAELPVPQQRQLAQEVLSRLGRVVQRLHDNSFAHRDLKSSNVLVRWAPQEAPEVVLLDLDGLSRKRRLSMSRRFQGLMRLNVSLLNCPTVSHAGRLRMLLGYLRRPGCGRLGFKPYWRVLETWSQKKIRRQIRSRRRRQKAARRPAG
jgi:tRNA A-37 threonylcarbamoyl transferase component Bud32